MQLSIEVLTCQLGRVSIQAVGLYRRIVVPFISVLY